MIGGRAATGIPQPEIQERLDRLLCDIRSAAQRQIGYPTNQNFDYSPLLPFLAYSINNVGDPFHTSNFRANTHEIEREVITCFADLMRTCAGRRLGLRYLRRHRRQYVRVVPGP